VANRPSGNTMSIWWIGRPIQNPQDRARVVHIHSPKGPTMHSKARLFGHPIHQMLIVFPLGLLATSFIFDLVHLATDSGRWADISFWMIASGIIGGLASAIFGLVDFLAIPTGTRAKRIGALHGIGNVIVTGLFAVSWFVRYDAPMAPEASAIVLSALAVALALVTSWLGGELVDRLAVGVDEGAHLDSPSSLSKRPASEHAHRRPAVSRTGT
jgi:uncharacterized membrane protein